MLHENMPKNRDTVGCVLYNSNKEFLLQKKTADYKYYPGAWVVFGGEIKSGENSKDAVIREILEETGIEINPVFVSSKQYASPLGNVSGEESMFMEEIKSIDPSRIKLTEGAGFAFFTLQEIKRLEKVWPDYKFFEVLYSKISNNAGDDNGSKK